MKITDLERKRFRIVCETADELEAAADCYNRTLRDDPIKRAALLVKIGKGKPVAVDAVASSEYVKKGGGFGRFSADVSEWFAPYWEALKVRTGCEPFAIDLTSTARRITHTHITEALHCDGATVSAIHIGHVYGMSGDKEITADQFERYGVASLREHVASEYGQSHTPPEFEEIGNGGLYRRNHGIRRTTYKPMAINEKLWQFLFGEWLAAFATDGQKALIKRFARVHRSSEMFPSLRDSHRDVIHLDNYQTSATWEQFRTA